MVNLKDVEFHYPTTVKSQPASLIFHFPEFHPKPMNEYSDKTVSTLPTSGITLDPIVDWGYTQFFLQPHMSKEELDVTRFYHEKARDKLNAVENERNDMFQYNSSLLQRHEMRQMTTDLAEEMRQRKVLSYPLEDQVKYFKDLLRKGVDMKKSRDFMNTLIANALTLSGMKVPQSIELEELLRPTSMSNAMDAIAEDDMGRSDFGLDLLNLSPIDTRVTDLKSGVPMFGEEFEEETQYKTPRGKRLEEYEERAVSGGGGALGGGSALEASSVDTSTDTRDMFLEALGFSKGMTGRQLKNTLGKVTEEQKSTFKEQFGKKLNQSFLFKSYKSKRR